MSHPAAVDPLVRDSTSKHPLAGTPVLDLFFPRIPNPQLQTGSERVITHSERPARWLPLGGVFSERRAQPLSAP